MGRASFFFPNDQSFIDFFNNINIAFLTVFIAKTFYTYKRMILFQKTKTLVTTWSVFEILIYGSLFLNFVHIPIGHPVAFITLALFCLFTFFLSLNMPWVAYLNYRQKWRGLMILFLILAIALSFARYIYDESSHFNNEKIHFIVHDMLHKPFIINVFIFIGLYSVTSILVITFNLPTSSVFEQKVGEVFSFQRLSQTIHSSDDVEHIYEVFLEMSMSTTFADAGWLEIIDPSTQKKQGLYKNIEEKVANEIRDRAEEATVDFRQKNTSIRDFTKVSDSIQSNGNVIGSALFIPLYFQDKFLGQLCLCKYVTSGFDNGLIEVISSFARQASLSIENSRLMREVIESELYKEEIKIAKTVKQKLLPEHGIALSGIEISHFSNSSDEVGGDYFDFFQVNDSTSVVIIADVTGHGTSAAFDMAQLKGVVHSAMQFEVNLTSLIEVINKAIGECLDRKTFISLTVLRIDSNEKTVESIRAGHCPTIYFNAVNHQVSYLDDDKKGLGLGILRDETYRDFVEKTEIAYQKGDFLMLFTDGIIETKNSEKDEYGFERLLEKVKTVSSNAPSEVIEHVISDLHNFAGDTKIDDDYTMLIMKLQ